MILAPGSVSISFIELPFLPITKPMRSFGTATMSQVSPEILPRWLSLVAPHLRHRRVFFIKLSQQADGEQREKILTPLISVTFQFRALSSIGENGNECGWGRGGRV